MWDERAKEILTRGQESMVIYSLELMESSEGHYGGEQHLEEFSGLRE